MGHYLYKEWVEKWKKGDIPFHRTEVNPLLTSFFPFESPPERVFVPLCGKSLDMAWLAEQGSLVVGVELVPYAVESFFKEQKISYTTKTLPHHTLYQSEKISIYCGDFFHLTPDITGTFPWIYDRAALVAVPKKARKHYAQHLSCFLSEKGVIHRVSLVYQGEEEAGPPYSVPKEEVERLFPEFYVKKLYEEEIFPLPPHFQKKGFSHVKNLVFQLHRR